MDVLEPWIKSTVEFRNHYIVEVRYFSLTKIALEFFMN